MTLPHIWQGTLGAEEKICLESVVGLGADGRNGLVYLAGGGTTLYLVVGAAASVRVPNGLSENF